MSALKAIVKLYSFLYYLIFSDKDTVFESTVSEKRIIDVCVEDLGVVHYMEVKVVFNYNTYSSKKWYVPNRYFVDVEVLYYFYDCPELTGDRNKFIKEVINKFNPTKFRLSLPQPLWFMESVVVFDSKRLLQDVIFD